MASHQITIEVDSNGQFRYSPTTCNVTSEDTVYWQTVPPTDAFVVKFLGQTPGDKLILRSGDTLTIGDTLGDYHYGSAVTHAGQIYIDAGCPDIVVTG